jgi:ribosome-associated toxin RatA of RatAB toxin-antitoxin module
MRRISRTDAPVDVMCNVLIDYDRWPEWMPGVQRVDILESDGVESLVEVIVHQYGRKLRQLQRCRAEPDGLRQTQIEGLFKKWETRWRVVAPPEGEGSTISLWMDVDPGFVGRLLPGGMWRGILDRLFEECLTGAEAQAHALTEQPTATPADHEVLLQVFETDHGLEVWVEGRRFLIEG